MSVYLIVSVLHKFGFSIFFNCLAALNNLITALHLASMVKCYLIKTLPNDIIYCIILNYPSNCPASELSLSP
jgi:hypothetical protein